MTPPSYWPDRDVPLIVDASAVINLNGTGQAHEILRALAREIVVVDEVVQELADGLENGRRDSERLGELVASGLVRCAALGETGQRLFEELTIGVSALTLEDGEAATIALASELGGAAVIDESKGRRLCATRLPGVPLIGSIEIFVYPEVQNALGGRLADAVFGALTVARMHVLPEYYEWVVCLLGAERAALCRSLPRLVRG